MITVMRVVEGLVLVVVIAGVAEKVAAEAVAAAGARRNLAARGLRTCSCTLNLSHDLCLWRVAGAGDGCKPHPLQTF